MTSDVSQAEGALRCRTGLACAAADAEGRAGSFRVWEHKGLLAVLASDPALGFLSTVSGVSRETVPAAVELLHAPVWEGVKATALSTDPDEAMEAQLAAGGLVRAGDRVLALSRLDTRVASTAGAPLEIVETSAEALFLDVLLAGYEVEGAVAAFIAAEHRLPMVRRFLALEQGTPIAGAAMSIHGDVAVLGGASTLQEHRSRGAQSQLLQHRLRQAAEARCTVAVATAAAHSVSADNLRRAGFRIHRRSAWRTA